VTDPVTETRRWVREVVVGLELCPFARGPLEAGRVRIVASDAESFEGALGTFVSELEHLVACSSDTLSNTLLVFSNADELHEFTDFLDLVDAAVAILDDAHASHLVQLASFHPDYVFAESDPEDPANQTNRSPHPMLHLLRVEEVEEAIARHPDIDAIPERNASLLRRLARQTE
jgi:hypothetical protein